MSGDERVSEEMRGAFVDGQLDAEEWARVAAAVEGDAQLREEVCRLRAVKELVRHAYAAAPSRAARARRAEPGWWSLVAASLAFSVAGWIGHVLWSEPPILDAASAYALRGDWRGLRGNWGALAGGRVLVHVSSGGHDALSSSLDEVEDLLRDTRASGHRIELEIVANGQGLDLLRANDGTFAPRLAALQRDYPDLHLVACGQTLERLRAEGRPVQLVPGASVASSALHEVVEKLRAGWIYVRT